MKYFSLIIILGLALAACSAQKQGEQKANTAIKNEVFKLVNQARAESRKCGNKSFPAAPELSYNSQLAKAAQNHSIEMNTAGVLSHLSPANSEFYSEGTSAIERIKQAGYDPLIIEENIAHGQLSAQEVVSDWLASPSHCASIMNSVVTDTGIGHDGRYWTQDFGKQR